MVKKDIMILGNEDDKKFKLSDFANNIILYEDRVLIIKLKIISVPIKTQNIFMLNSKASSDRDSKFGIGRIIKVGDSSNRSYKANDHVFFNKWNACLEFVNNNQSYYIVKLADIHAKINLEKYSEEKEEKEQ